MVHVIETTNGRVINVCSFLNAPGFDANQAAENLAKTICYQNGIEFQGNISCDGSPKDYSVQIFKVE